MEEKSQVRAITRGVALWLAVATTALGQNAPFKILHTFGGTSDGVGPSSGVIFDKQGNLYGETLSGGNPSCAYGCGLVYELSPQESGGWTETILYEFTGGSDGDEPNGGLAMDASGNLYGVTRFGGANEYGTAFELSPGGDGWTETILHSFCTPPSCADGWEPLFAPVLDSAGSLYGTAGEVAYELSPGPSGWAETVLYTFCSQPNCSDGDFPEGLVRDAAGNFYGPTYEGGRDGGGVIFALRPKPVGGWAYVVLYNFQGGDDGETPNAVTLHGKALYGTTPNGGGLGQCTDSCGTVFELAANPVGGPPVETILHRFAASAQGVIPQGPVAFDRLGNMYGVTSYGGTGCGGGCGVVYEMKPGSGGTWQYQVVHQFNGQDGVLPQYVSTDRQGNVYGTTLGGGAPYYGGVVFEVVPTSPTAK